MPHDLEIIGQTVLPKENFGQHDSVLIQSYEAPSTPDGGVAADPFKEFDAHCCKGMMELLNHHFPAYVGFWAVRHDWAQKIAGISLPVLMGINNWMVINLTTDSLSPGLVIASGGEILERYGLSRVRFNLGAFLDARSKHSSLLVQTRKVPT